MPFHDNLSRSQLVASTFILFEDNHQSWRTSDLCKNLIKRYVKDSRLEQAELDESEVFQWNKNAAETKDTIG